ncbi:uncharacterized protein LOC143508738 [Brachyhypopomus gauderio]
MKVPENVVSASLVLQQLTGGSESENRRGRPQLDDQAAYDLLVRAHPVTVDGVPPKRSVRTAMTQLHERYCYDRWRCEQLQMRIQHVLEHFGRRQPSESCAPMAGQAGVEGERPRCHTDSTTVEARWPS